jgi:glycosyltransferase involved in cell wall biosynthesis
MTTMLFISPGPTYNSRSPQYQRAWETLSQRFRGYVFTTSPKAETIDIGRFVYMSMNSRNRLLDSLRFLVFCVAKSVALGIKGERIALVATYDPLKTGLVGAVVARIHGARLVTQVNGVYTSDAQWLDEKASIVNRLKKRVYPAVMRFVLKRADGIRLLFEAQLAPFQDILGGKVVRVFHSSVRTSAFTNLGEKKEVLLVGHPFKLKGVDVLIEAFKRVAPAYPDWTLKILGWYPDPRQMQAAIGGHPQIHHHPAVRHSEMPEHIGSCAILVLPSRSEAMGRVLVEAMAAEKPRIGSRVDGIPTVINDGVDGYLVEPGSVADLAEKLDRLMRDPGLRRSMGMAGKARVAREFAEKVCEENAVAFYDEVLAS